MTVINNRNGTKTLREFLRDRLLLNKMGYLRMDKTCLKRRAILSVNLTEHNDPYGFLFNFHAFLMNLLWFFHNSLKTLRWEEHTTVHADRERPDVIWPLPVA
jgi:hypothetical protein